MRPQPPSHDTTPLPEQLQYPWPPNLTTYEVRLWLGLTAQQWVFMAMGLILPMGMNSTIWGFLMGVGVGVVIFLSFKKVGRWGGISFPRYVGVRLMGLLQREVEVIELPLILGGAPSTVELEDWDGEVMLVLEGE